MDENKPWTKRELSPRLGPVELAKAVIEQWKLDECPKQDEQAIEYWKEIIRRYSK